MKATARILVRQRVRALLGSAALLLVPGAAGLALLQGYPAQAELDARSYYNSPVDLRGGISNLDVQRARFTLNTATGPVPVVCTGANIFYGDRDANILRLLGSPAVQISGLITGPTADMPGGYFQAAHINILTGPTQKLKRSAWTDLAVPAFTADDLAGTGAGPTNPNAGLAQQQPAPPAVPPAAPPAAGASTPLAASPTTTIILPPVNSSTRTIILPPVNSSTVAQNTLPLLAPVPSAGAQSLAGATTPAAPGLPAPFWVTVPAPHAAPEAATVPAGTASNDTLPPPTTPRSSHGSINAPHRSNTPSHGSVTMLPDPATGSNATPTTLPVPTPVFPTTSSSTVPGTAVGSR